MQIQCIEDAVYNAAGQYSCMDTTSIISPSLCYSGKGIFVQYVLLLLFIGPSLSYIHTKLTPLILQ